MQDNLHEECGVMGVFNKREDVDTAQMIYFGLYALQHRGQESAGIAVNNNGRIRCHKRMGMVPQVFDDFTLNNLKGDIGIGHVRYSTSGQSIVENAQPIVLRYREGDMALAHNGNITNRKILRKQLQEMGFVFQGTADTEVIAALLSRESIHTDSIQEAVKEVMSIIKGAYAFTIMTSKKLLAVRDPLGMKPLCIGKMEDTYIIASETAALDSIGAEYVRDVLPGEIVVIDDEGIKSFEGIKSEKTALCSFEYVYFARPDSTVDGASVYQSRLEAGRLLARQYKIDADIVIGVPASGIAAALGYSEESRIPYAEGFVKNRYVGRTFIQPTQFMREQSVKLKLNVLKEQIQGKRIIMVDDSIVRGTTSKKIVKLLRDAGAKEVHLLLSSPPVKFSCHFGVDTPNRDKLIANTHTLKEMEEAIGVDTVGFLSVENLEKSPIGVRCNLCTACFSGEYPIEIE